MVVQPFENVCGHELEALAVGMGRAAMVAKIQSEDM
jgi:hypothetical protein